MGIHGHSILTVIALVLLLFGGLIAQISAPTALADIGLVAVVAALVLLAYLVPLLLVRQEPDDPRDGRTDGR
ncbi:MAG: hypothetical protein JWM93_2484 [Frankiales bacterium]|nr:hypothetical protein [Frankiales bacterium]MCW3016833.1 hypothetical protein [Solirubrobacterales bacterium]